MSLKLSNPTFGVGKILVEDIEVLSLSNGSTGLGTSLPNSTFDVASADASPVLSLTATGAYRYQVLTDRSTTSFRIRDQSAGSVDRLIIDAAGNAGFGVFPSPWRAIDTAVQIKNTIVENVNDTTGVFGYNYYRDESAVSRYINTSFAGQIIVNNGNNGSIAWNVASSGTAGDPITFTQAMTLTNGGNLGIGSTSPSAPLSFGKAVYGAPNSEDFYRIKFEDVGGIGNDIGIGQPVSGAVGINLSPSTGYFAVYTGTNGERFRINAAGNMGLGIVPSAWGSSYKAIQVNNASLSAFSTTFGFFGLNWYNDGTNSRYISTGAATAYQQNLGAHAWQVAPSGNAGDPITFTQAMTLTNGGNLLVGTTTDSGAKLEIGNRTIGSQQDSYKLIINRGITGQYAEISARNGSVFLNGVNGSGGGITFNGDGTERARITTGGYFKASNTGSYGGVAGLVDQTNTDAHLFQGNGTSVTLAAATGALGSGIRNFSSFLATGAAGDHFNGAVNNVVVYKVLANGNVQNTNNSYGAISDIKLKENITDTSPKLDELTQVRIVNYTLKSDPDLKQIGVIAQELEEIFPGLVDSTPDVDEEGNDLGTVTKSVKYSVFVPILIKALQEETAARKSLEDRIAAIEAKLGQ